MAAMRQVFKRCGFTTEASNAMEGVQAIDSIEELRLLKDSEIESLCKVIRRPGGTIADPDNDGQVIPNPGFPVALRSENNLKLAAYWLRLQVKVNRVTTPALVMLDTVRTVRELRDSDIAYSAPTEYPVINDKDWPRTIESIVEFLGTFLGETKIPLAYVTLRPSNFRMVGWGSLGQA